MSQSTGPAALKFKMQVADDLMEGSEALSSAQPLGCMSHRDTLQ